MENLEKQSELNKLLFAEKLKGELGYKLNKSLQKRSCFSRFKRIFRKAFRFHI